MKILALEPYYGGSHKAFLDGLKKYSSHDWTILGLPDYKWKWRMRHSAITFAQQVKPAADVDICQPQKQARLAADEGVGQPQNPVGGTRPRVPQLNWDLIFCSDMLNLAEFKGLVNNPVKDLPSVAYFHENQLTYPVQNPDERDLHLAMINFTTCLSATEIWFNSEFHRASYLGALEQFLKRMPDYQHVEKIEEIKNKSSVVYPGIDYISKNETRLPGPIRILWAARWEYDKNPETFFNAIRILKEKEIDFRLSVIGSQFTDMPGIFEKAKAEFGDKIIHWGYQKTRKEYIHVLQKADVVVSTANHEFFGISIIEAITAGAFPLLPNKLSYPELLGSQNNDDFFYDGSAESLADKLVQMNNILINKPSLWVEVIGKATQIVEKFQWTNIIRKIDTKLSSILPR
ncbi:MAG: DUF3524 domain-containing protein [bacterium]